MGVLCCFFLATGSVRWIVEKCCTTCLINTGTPIMASVATMRGLHVAFYETQEPGPSIVVNLEHVGSLISGTRNGKRICARTATLDACARQLY